MDFLLGGSLEPKEENPILISNIGDPLTASGMVFGGMEILRGGDHACTADLDAIKSQPRAAVLQEEMNRARAWLVRTPTIEKTLARRV